MLIYGEQKHSYRVAFPTASKESRGSNRGGVFLPAQRIPVFQNGKAGIFKCAKNMVAFGSGNT